MSFRVTNLDAMMEQLRGAGVSVPVEAALTTRVAGSPGCAIPKPT